jgi:hypothetical protein
VRSALGFVGASAGRLDQAGQFIPPDDALPDILDTAREPVYACRRWRNEISSRIRLRLKFRTEKEFLPLEMGLRTWLHLRDGGLSLARKIALKFGLFPMELSYFVQFRRKGKSRQSMAKAHQSHRTEMKKPHVPDRLAL